MANRVRMVIDIDLDGLPGAMHTGRDAAATVEAILDQRMPHYNPTVEVMPMYEHDCDSCQYVGTFYNSSPTARNGWEDWYCCAGAAEIRQSGVTGISLIRRQSGEVGDYHSFPLDCWSEMGPGRANFYTLERLIAEAVDQGILHPSLVPVRINFRNH